MKEDGTGGVKGMTTITYTFEDVGEGVTLGTRNLTCELPRGVSLPGDLLTVCCRPNGIERYHDAIKKELDEKQKEVSGYGKREVWEGASAFRLHSQAFSLLGFEMITPNIIPHSPRTEVP
ncbi:uncharacterized protein LTR77_006184 [Saxophila tyrrhenica]|uniref:Uncharacterized protein n=1 Tax=Saxophila tyrrhenica TaxID=1690608 RepID=A0AAV9PBC2_9PEZI|nr:hypothetical protein LTR77_006184 [Saxophila tyrrhenica]